MRRSIAMGIAAALVLVGCGGGEPDTAPQATVTVTVTEYATVTATPVSEPSSSSSEFSTAEASPTAAESESDGPTMSARGTLVKQVGESAGLNNEFGESLIRFTVTELDPDFECAQKSENGKFVALTITAATTEELASEPHPELFFRDWTIVGADGKLQNAHPDTSAAWKCVSDADRFPSPLGPSVSAEGVIVLDVTPESGVVILAMGDIIGGGWEWSY